MDNRQSRFAHRVSLGRQTRARLLSERAPAGLQQPARTKAGGGKSRLDDLCVTVNQKMAHGASRGMRRKLRGDILLLDGRQFRAVADVGRCGCHRYKIAVMCAPSDVMSPPFRGFRRLHAAIMPSCYVVQYLIHLTLRCPPPLSHNKCTLCPMNVNAASQKNE